jgi:very-short-patch-repair endonuclease
VDNLCTAAEMLKHREAWKYVLLKEALKGRDYEFEFPLVGCVFDLALKDTAVIVEFDGRYHNDPCQQIRDEEKRKIAEAAGYRVVRRSVEESKVIEPSVIRDL